MRSLGWRYAKASVRVKIAARELTNRLIHLTLSDPDSIVLGKKDRWIAQKKHRREGFGNLLIRVVYEERDAEKVVVTAYWARLERYGKRERA